VLSILRALALLTVVFTASCHQPEIGAERARDYFSTHRTEMEAIVDQVELCEPDDGRIDDDSDFRCWSSQGSPESLLDAMTAADAPWIRVNYNQREDRSRELASVLIALPSSYGFSFAGVTEAFLYEPHPATAGYVRTDQRDSVTLERLPMTEAPHHWYWWKADR